jgi:hypothetical protein
MYTIISLFLFLMCCTWLTGMNEVPPLLSKAGHLSAVYIIQVLTCIMNIHFALIAHSAYYDVVRPNLTNK